MRILPKVRTTDLVLQKSGREMLIYDLNSNKATCLNETCAIVWNHCDGETSTSYLIEQYDLTEELIAIAIDALQGQDLITANFASGVPGQRIERRRFLQRTAAASTVALPIIGSLTAPESAMAQSCVGPGTLPLGNHHCEPTTGGVCDGVLCCSGSAAVSGLVSCMAGFEPCQCTLVV